ncbi:hypothetical protein Mgra_00003907 [Meloidogyne graminicola]|uniref:Transmembrane protein n=1 Tax=Meloidogyne graminicola TaxID=189291 RepID=A0A8S9ZTA9_9BILA|nr:hypothetical protein Mgra_00003907 [Meloidogyne graminicola]
MMFINPRHVDVDCYDEENDIEKGKQRGGRRRRLRQGDGQNGYLQDSSAQLGDARLSFKRITLILVCIYLFISACLALFYYPLSILSIVPFPIIIVTITIFAAMNKKVDEITTLWFCAIASVCAFGAFGKLIAIIVFSSIFGFTRGIEVENRRRGGMQLIPKTHEDVSRNELWLTQFFIVLLAAEASIMLTILCIRCNFRFFKKFMNSNGHLV